MYGNVDNVTIVDLLAKIKADVHDQVVPELCIELATFLLSDKAQNLSYMNYSTFRQELRLNPQDEAINNALVAATTYLVRKDLSFLEMHFQFFDDELDEPIPLDDSDVVLALNSKEFFHPYTGIEIADFESSLFPYFEPAATLRSIHDK